MLAIGSPTSIRTSNSCNALLRELQQIWTDIGESEAEKDQMLFELERECLEVYWRKVDEAANAKARLHQSVAAKEAELATLMAALRKLNIHSPVYSPCLTSPCTVFMEMLMGSRSHEKAGVAARGWWWLRSLLEKVLAEVVDTAKKIKKLRQDDPRRVVHSLKVGLAITLVSLFYYFRPLYDNFGVSAMWAVMTGGCL